MLNAMRESLVTVTVNLDASTGPQKMIRAFRTAGFLFFIIGLLLTDAVAEEDFKVFVIRHCAYGKGGGLTDAGKAHARKIGQYLSDKGVSDIYYSEVVRTEETAGIIRKAFKGDTTFQKHDLLNYKKHKGPAVVDLLKQLRKKAKSAILVTHSPMVEALVSAYKVKAEAIEFGCVLLFQVKDGKLIGQKVKLKKESRPPGK